MRMMCETRIFVELFAYQRQENRVVGFEEIIIRLTVTAIVIGWVFISTFVLHPNCLVQQKIVTTKLEFL